MVSPWNKSEKSGEGFSGTNSPERHARSFAIRATRDLDLDTVQDDKVSLKDEIDTPMRAGSKTEGMFLKGHRQSSQDEGGVGGRSDTNSLDG